MKKKQPKILLIGATPPPIGGVSIHVTRLLSALQSSNFKVDIIRTNTRYSISDLKRLFSSELIHLHVSKAILKLFGVLIARLLGKKVIITNHGRLGRKNERDNRLDLLANKLASASIVLNNESLTFLEGNSKQVHLITSFLYPTKINPLNSSLDEKMKSFTKRYPESYCTNAYSIKRDAEGNEIYSIKKLVEVFQSMPNKGLVVSEPSGEYVSWYKENNIHIPENVLFIGELHDFVNVIERTKGFIRATTTDGDSLSVREALYLGKNVVVTDCVDRPSGCTLFKLDEIDSLESVLDNLKESDEIQQKEATQELLALYSSLIC